MQTRKHKALWLALLCLVLLLALPALQALASQPNLPGVIEPFDLSWWTVDGGGGTSTGGGYRLSGTIAQPDAGELSGGGYSLTGGFWPAARPTGVEVFLPLVAH